MFSFIETGLFTRVVQEYLGDGEYRELQKSFMDNPETGNVITGSSGIRKLLIYYVKRSQGVIWMLTMYPKNVAENISAHVLRQIRKEVEDG